MLPCFLKKKDNHEDDVEEKESLDYDESILKEPPLQKLSIPETDSAPQIPVGLSSRFLFYMLATLTPVLAIPTLLIFLIKSPAAHMDVTFLGVSYYKIFLVFLISSVSLIVSSVLFLRTNLQIMAALFITSLFCSIPLVVGLKHNLTMQQAIMDIGIFSSWPFFLTPFFILISILLPAGILIFLFLQVRSIFSREQHSYVFLGTAAFLALALYLGSYELSRAQIPNILMSLHSPSHFSPINEEAPSGKSLQDEFQQPEQPSQPLSPVSLPQEENIQQEAVMPIQITEVNSFQPELSSAANSFINDNDRQSFTDEALRIEEKLNHLLQEIDGKIIKLTQLKSSIDAQKENDLSAINQNIMLLGKKIDMAVANFNDKPQENIKPNLFPEPARQKDSGEATKSFSSSEKNSTLSRVINELDALTQKVETIQTENKTTH